MAKGGDLTRLDWRGIQISLRVVRAAVAGINDTMAAAVNEAKRNHPGWRNQTGNAEGSIAIIEPAHIEGRGVTGRWGSQGVNYMIILEMLRGAALRHAGDKTYPSLKRRVAAHYAMDRWQEI